MGLTAAQIATDLGRISTSTNEMGAREQVTHEPATGTGSDFNVTRARTLSAKELENTGWANQYQLSVYDIDNNGGSVAIGDILIMTTEGRLRVLDISRGPTLHYRRFDLGDEFGGNP